MADDTVDTGSTTTAAPSAASSLASAASAAATQDAPAGSGGPGTSHPGTGQPGAQTPATPGQTPPANADLTARGPLPFDRHESILRNTREQTAKETREAVAREYAQKFGWAEKMDPQQVQRAMQMMSRLNDPKSAREFAAQLTQELGQLDDNVPEPDIVSNDGKVKAYSADAMQRFAAVIENRLRREMQPLMQDREQAQTRAKVAEQVEQGKTVMRDALTHARTSLPQFKDNEAAISKEMEGLPPGTVDRIGIIGAMYMAYGNYMAKVYPTLQVQAEGKVRDDFQKKAAAATGQVAPNGGNATPNVKRMRNENDLAAHMEQLAAAGGTV